MDGQVPSPTSPGLPHLRCHRRASEASIASQVSGMADSYTASNIATSESTAARVRLLSGWFRARRQFDTLTLLFPPPRHASPPRPPSAREPDAGPCKRPGLLAQLALPYSRLASRSSSLRSRKTVRRVFPGSEPVTSDLTPDVTADVADFSSAPPSPGLLKNMEKGTRGGREGRAPRSILVPCDLSFLLSDGPLIVLVVLQCQTRPTTFSQSREGSQRLSFAFQPLPAAPRRVVLRLPVNPLNPPPFRLAAVPELRLCSSVPCSCRSVVGQ